MNAFKRSSSIGVLKENEVPGTEVEDSILVLLVRKEESVKEDPGWSREDGS